MRTRGAIGWIAVGALAILLVLPNVGGAVVLPYPDYDLSDGFANSLLSGNVIVYSMPFLNNLEGYPAKPVSGDPYYVDSQPGQIKIDVVIGTGSSGDGVTTNPNGIENSYPTPNGDKSAPAFSTVATDPYAAPQPEAKNLKKGEIEPISPTVNTWDADTAALRTFLGNGECSKLVFWFNQNETGEGAENDLYVWMKFELVDTVFAEGETPEKTITYYLSALDDPLTPDDEWEAGLTASKLGTPLSTDPNTDPEWSHVHGLITVDADGNFLHFGDVRKDDPATPEIEPSDPYGAKSIAQNLGANNATFAGYIPGLSDEVKNVNSPYESLRITWVMRDINNGYEQLFIMPACIGPEEEPVVPEPASLGIWAVLSLTTGLGAWRSRRKHAA